MQRLAEVSESLPPQKGTEAASEAQQRIAVLEQQVAELKRQLELRDQAKSGAVAPAPNQPEPDAARPTQAAASTSSASQTNLSLVIPSERVAPAWLRTTEGMVLTSVLLAALFVGFVVLWRMRTPIHAAPPSDDESWPPELRKARDAINRAAGRDAGLESQSPLEKAVDGRFPIPDLDFVEGVREGKKSERKAP
ncbi:MAG: hypothetical protein EBX17_12165 [Betaproteobacteria bacterium]|nr:hypothetical protein [Betaproteobacteria bacterium]NCX23916.1 hypothetical protein [Betaproteobacteria bacterium]NCZ75683.1 hypothetical protein [Betaproteobacteria bacterium]NDB12615.1 hypothetical protein [Betaproteobacteria bacterium]